MSQELDLDRLESLATAAKAKAPAYAALGAPCAVHVDADVLLTLLRAAREKEEAENLRDQFEARAKAAERGEQEAEARAEKWKGVADSWARDAARWKAIYPHMGFVAWPLHEHTLATEPPPSSTEKE